MTARTHRDANEAAELRQTVGHWLRVRAKHIEESVGIAGHFPHLSKTGQHLLLTQLAADADHSDLLFRLFMGEEPLPFADWRAGQR